MSTAKVSEEETKRKCRMSAFPPDTPLRWNDGQSRKKSAGHQSANKEEKKARPPALLTSSIQAAELKQSAWDYKCCDRSVLR